MTNLTEFLLARLAEDEERAQRGADAMAAFPELEDNAHWSFRRLLAECDAKRRIVGMIFASPLDITTHYGRERVYTLFHLAMPYADHPDYDPAWRP